MRQLPAVTPEAAVPDAPHEPLRDLRLQVLLHEDQCPDRTAHIAVMRRNCPIHGQFKLFRFRDGIGCATSDFASPVDLADPRCSYFVLVKSSSENRRFPRPWKVEEEDAQTLVVTDANGVKITRVYHREASSRYYLDVLGLSADEARRIANAISRLLEFLMQRRGFCQRGSGTYRSKPSRPYHVAQEDT